MAVRIDTTACVGCDLCVPVCPNRAIAQLWSGRNPVWVVDPDLCSECQGFYSESQCTVVCPAQVLDCITIDPAHAEGPDQLLARGQALSGYRQSIGYPANYAYRNATGMAPAPGEYGPKPA